jgi:hypothetical protein
MNKTKTEKGIKIFQSFRSDCVVDVDPGGSIIEQYKKGVEVEIELNNDGRGTWQVASTHDDGYGSGSLSIEGKEIVDYDGCFELPSRVKEILVKLGYKVL